VSWRRWWRGLYLISAWTLAVLALGWLGARLWALHVVRTAVPEFEREHGSLDRSQWRRERPPDSENGALRYRAAIELVGSKPGESWRRWREAVRAAEGEPLGPEMDPLLEAVAAEHATALALLREGADRPVCVFNAELGEPNEKLPNLLALLHLGQLQSGLAAAERRRGELGSATRYELDLAALAACLERDPVLVVHLIGAALERRLLSYLRAAVADGAGDLGSERLAESLPADDPLGIADRIRAEAAAHSPDAAWWSGFEGSVADGAGRSWLDPFTVPGLRGAMHVRGLGLAIDALRSEGPPAPAGASPWTVPPGERRTVPAEADPWIAWQPWRWDRHVLESQGRNYWIYDRTERAQAAARALARAALRVRVRGIADGSYPATLVDVAPELAEPTLFVGEAIRYEVAADGSARLTLPASEEQWQRIRSLPETTWHFDFAWRLPSATAKVGTPPVDRAPSGPRR